jgi:hypothetical protein
MLHADNGYFPEVIGHSTGKIVSPIECSGTHLFLITSRHDFSIADPGIDRNAFCHWSIVETGDSYT